MRFVVLVLIGSISYGVLSTFVKMAYAGGFGVKEVTGGQITLGAVVLIAIWLLRGVRRAIAELGTLTAGGASALMLVGSTVGLTGYCYYSALQYIPASAAIVLLFQFSWMGVAIEAVMLRKAPDKGKLLSVAVLMAGTLAASGWSGGAWAELPLEGVALGLMSALSYAVFLTTSGKVAAATPPLTRSAVMMAGAAILTTLFIPPDYLFDGSIGEGLWLWGGLLALFGVVVPTLCYMTGVPKIGSGLASILGAAELPTAVLMSFLVLGEQVTALQGIGVAVILAGLALPELVGGRKPFDRRGNAY